MTTQTFILDEDAVRVEITFNRETISATGYQDVIELSEDGEDGEYMTFHKVFSGYTVPEILCIALMEMDRAEDWTEAIGIIEEAGICYVTDEDDEEE